MTEIEFNQTGDLRCNRARAYFKGKAVQLHTTQRNLPNTSNERLVMDIEKEKKNHTEWFKGDDPVAFSLVSSSQEYERDFSLSERTWLAAKAQAVPEVKLSHCVTLTCAQLREAFMFGAPDGDDQEQLETEMTIVWSEDGHSGKGYYCYYSELPEEGAIFLDEMIETQEQNQ